MHSYQRTQFWQGHIVECGISTRNDGNMCFYQANGIGVIENRKHYFEKTGIDTQFIFMPDVVHGNEIIEITNKDLSKGVYDVNEAAKVDGVISSIPGSTLAVDTGDCPVILISDTQGLMIGLIHAGWQSLDKGIIKRMLGNICNKIEPCNILVVIGVGICKGCYSFPDDSNHPLINNPSWNTYKQHKSNNTIAIDLYSYIYDQLVSLGVPENNLSLLENNSCTCHTMDNEGKPKYFSHRRAMNESSDSAKEEGRFITWIHLPIHLRNNLNADKAK